MSCFSLGSTPPTWSAQIPFFQGGGRGHFAHPQLPHCILFLPCGQTPMISHNVRILKSEAVMSVIFFSFWYICTHRPMCIPSLLPANELKRARMHCLNTQPRNILTREITQYRLSRVQQSCWWLLSWVLYFPKETNCSRNVLCRTENLYSLPAGRQANIKSIACFHGDPSEAFIAPCRKQPLNNLQCCWIKLLLTPSAHCWPHGTQAAGALVYHLLHRHWHLQHGKPGSNPFLFHFPSFILHCFTFDTEPISPS